MKPTAVRLALIVSGHNAFSEQFHTFPEQAVGIIEVRTKPRRSLLYSWVWAALQWLFPQRFMDCQLYCQQHGYQHAVVSKTSDAELVTALKKWDINLVLTFSVPLLPLASINHLSHGALNLHASCLPAYRGGNPLLWQVIDGVQMIGVSVHTLAATADSGKLVGQTEFNRPYGVSRERLHFLANIEQGLPLIKDCIASWVGTPANAIEQTPISPTAAANHFPFTELLKVMEERQVSLAILWDVACFLQYWPSEALPFKGWQSWFRWIPIAVNSTGLGEVRDLRSRKLCFAIAGARLHLHHPEGYVVFAPKFHGITFLARTLVGHNTSLE